MGSKVLERVNIGALVQGLVGYAHGVTVADTVMAAQAVDLLRKTSLPESYVDGLEDELMRVMGQKLRRPKRVSTYLAFYGNDDMAEYVKVGVSKDVHIRMKDIRTGNPLPRLWLYSARFEDRRTAMSVESAILSHVDGDRVTGEWAKLGGMSADAVRAVVSSLGEVASDLLGRPVEFRGHGSER